nr:hypothetical protein OG461_35805 [Streptomyces sp. NBC_00995]
MRRKVVSPDDFTDLAQVGDRLRAFEDSYNASAQPVQYKVTTSDLGRHSADHPEESAVALTA